MIAKYMVQHTFDFTNQVTVSGFAFSLVRFYSRDSFKIALWVLKNMVR